MIRLYLSDPLDSTHACHTLSGRTPFPPQADQPQALPSFLKGCASIAHLPRIIQASVAGNRREATLVRRGLRSCLCNRYFVAEKRRERFYQEPNARSWNSCLHACSTVFPNTGATSLPAGIATSNRPLRSRLNESVNGVRTIFQFSQRTSSGIPAVTPAPRRMLFGITNPPARSTVARGEIIYHSLRPSDNYQQAQRPLT